MTTAASQSLKISLAALVVTLGLLVGGTYFAVKLATDNYLHSSAGLTARNWAQLLATTVTDLDHIASGQLPSRASMTFFEWARRAGNVQRYEIYNLQGLSQLVAEDKVAQVNLSSFSPEALEALRTNAPVVWVGEGTASGDPEFVARAYVPAVVDGRPVAVVGAHVDQTQMRSDVSRSFLLASLTACALTGVAFGVPALAWIRRTREKQDADRRIRFLAHHDALTGLINRPQLLERLEGLLAATKAGGPQIAVHFIDLDRFKEVNDSLGHAGGDFLLRSVADRLREVTRAQDYVARLGGDEFVVVQSEVDSKATAEAFAGRMLALLGKPLPYNEQQIVAAGSIGVAIGPEDGATPERLLKSADLALYKSKADGRARVTFFTTEMDAELQARLELERALREAVRGDGFVLHYQPLFDMPSGRLLGFEALVRLPLEDGVLVPPLTFIPVAEEIRLIGDVGAFVLREACKAAAGWPAHLMVAVNLSPAQFEAGSISDMVAEALAVANLPPERLELEITETLLLGDSAEIMAELMRLKAMHVRIVMDDFGTGYSSLSYLWKFPFDKIKIDRSFMQGFDGTGRDAETVVKTIIALGRELHMRVTVEGVETARQADFLAGVDADQVQGFYFSRPLAPAEVAACILADFRRETRPAAAIKAVEAG